MLDALNRYFDLNAAARAKGVAAVAPGGPTGPTTISAWIQYAVLVAGILIEPSFTAYQTNHSWVWPYGWGYLLFSVIVGVIIFPGVYRRTFDDENPSLVSLGPIFTSGLGWQSLLATAVSAVAPAVVTPTIHP